MVRNSSAKLVVDDDYEIDLTYHPPPPPEQGPITHQQDFENRRHEVIDQWRATGKYTHYTLTTNISTTLEDKQLKAKVEQFITDIILDYVRFGLAIPYELLYDQRQGDTSGIIYPGIQIYIPDFMAVRPIHDTLEGGSGFQILVSGNVKYELPGWDLIPGNLVSPLTVDAATAWRRVLVDRDVEGLVKRFFDLRHWFMSLRWRVDDYESLEFCPGDWYYIPSPPHGINYETFDAYRHWPKAGVSGQQQANVEMHAIQQDQANALATLLEGCNISPSDMDNLTIEMEQLLRLKVVIETCSTTDELDRVTALFRNCRVVDCSAEMFAEKLRILEC